MSSMYDTADEEIGESLEQWVASLVFPCGQEELDKPQWSVSVASENHSGMNRDVVSSIVQTENDKAGILEPGQSLHEHAPLCMTVSSSVRPPLQPSNSQSSSLEANFVQRKGVGRRRTGVMCQYPVRYQHSVAERHHQPISRLRSPGSLQGSCMAGDFKGINRAFDVLHEDRILVAREKRPRSPTWSAEEKQAYLMLKVEACRVVKGKHWDFISQSLRERWGFERSSKCCADFWYTIRRSYRAIQQHEVLGNDPLRSKWVSYWDMDEEKRSKKKLPKSFPLEWFDMIKRILTAQPKRFGKTSRGSMAAQELYESEDDDEYSNQQPHLGEQPHMTIQAEITNFKYAGRERFSAIHEEPLVQQQVDDVVDSALQRLGYRMRLGSTTEDDQITMLTTVVKQKVQDAINADDLMTKLAPYFKKHIEDVLERKLRPVASALQVREQEEREEQEYEEALRALAEKKRALVLEERQLLKRRRVGRHQRTYFEDILQAPRSSREDVV